MNTESSPVAGRWPPQIKYIVGNEACERFSYYGMTSILAGYISGELARGGLGKSQDDATAIIHFFKFANYFMPLVGAWLSDKVIGRYHTILWVSLFYCSGHGVLACSDLAGGVSGKVTCLMCGLALIAFGAGGIKPCVSAFMGDQFRPEQSHLLQKAYGAFYWAINFGSFFSFLVIPWVKEHHGYSWAFGVPGILMALATLIFWLGTKYYVRIPTSRQTKHAGFLQVFFRALFNQPSFPWAAVLNFLAVLGLPLLAIVVMSCLSFVEKFDRAARLVGWSSLACVGVWYALLLLLSLLGRTELPDQFWRAASSRYSEGEINAARSLGPILFVFALVPLFWSLFDQTNSTWVMQGQRMEPLKLPGFRIGAEEMQSTNPAIVMLLVPLFTLGVYPRIGKLASPLRRMSCGMFLAAVSYLAVAALQKQIEAGAHLSVMRQFVPYVILTAGEVLMSTTGLEFAFREAAPEMKSTVMSLWLITVAFGNLLVTVITRLLSADTGGRAASVSAERFLLYAGMTLVVAILFSVVAAFYRYRDCSAAEGK